ncbi:unnamed protein product [Moneuplotes crassus]|uniref:Uncharacterized protein n=1 Tax=Euplotes crassus TaxID=5936 RepID=A0AAD2D971_EUPCR|nr:unnamed protein product [Moneuplotes crassus]
MATIVPINVDLNKLFEAKLTYGFDPLKEAIEGLLRNQELHNKMIQDLVEEQKENSLTKNQNKDLLEKLNSQNDKIENLENNLKDHEDRIKQLEDKSDDHENRIKELEEKLENSKTHYDYSQTVVNNGKQRPVGEELENELKHLLSRVDNTEKNLEKLLKKKSDFNSTVPTSETIDNDDEEDTRESLENQLQLIKTRLSRVEDSNNELKNTIKNSSDEKEDGDESVDKSYADEVDKNIQELRQKIKEIEEKLKKLRESNRPSKMTSSSDTKGSDYTNVIIDLSERVEALEQSNEKTIERVDDHNERIEKLEKETDSNKDKIMNNKNDINELKDTIVDKVDADLFDNEISYLKELLNQIGSSSGEKIEIPQLPPPKAGLSTKDANKLKELAAKVPELERLINDILERLGRAENNIENHDKNIKGHDKSIEEIWAELAKKANTNDLKDLFDRLNQLENDLEKLVEYMNNNDKGKPTALPTMGKSDDKRLKNLEEKVEDLRNHCNQSLRDIEKTLEALNSELKGTNKDVSDLKDDLLKLMQKINKLEHKVNALADQKQNSDTPVAVQTGADADKLEDLRKQLNELRNDYRNFKNEVLNQFNNVNNELDRKANLEDLENLKKLLKNKLEDLEKALNKTKNDLKRALRILNDKIARGAEASQPKEDRDDAMFSKKPLQGVSCASCDKNVVNLQGLPADFYNWKKLPQSKDRIPMMGQGFSRMLQSISNEYLAPSHSPVKTSYNGFKEDSVASGRSNLKRRPGSGSGGANMQVDDIETEAASKMLPSINQGKN